MGISCSFKANDFKTIMKFQKRGKTWTMNSIKIYLNPNTISFITFTPVYSRKLT